MVCTNALRGNLTTCLSYSWAVRIRISDKFVCFFILFFLVLLPKYLNTHKVEIRIFTHVKENFLFVLFSKGALSLILPLKKMNLRILYIVAWQS